MPSATDLADPQSFERLWTGARWSEGPAWIARAGTAGRLRWSDIIGDRILEFDPVTGRTSEYATEVEYVNGRTLDLAGDVVQCSHGRRRVERDVGGVVTPIVAEFDGRRFNSPNDVVVASDGAIWFTDPPYGLRPDGLEGHPGEQEYEGCFVFRFDEATGVLTAEVTDMEHPNGLAFSPDESLLYVADTGPGHHDIRVYEITVDRAGDAHAGAGRTFVEVHPGVSDGFRVDVAGRIWTSSGDAVQVLDADGRLLARYPVPEVVANVCFGGPDGRDLYITATTSLYRLRTHTAAAPRPARRSGVGGGA